MPHRTHAPFFSPLARSIAMYANRLRSSSSASGREQSRQELVENATRIYKRFVPENAEAQINIKSATRAKLAKDMSKKRITPNMFRSAQSEIYALMEADNYARFKAGPLFEQFLVEMGAYAAMVEPSQMRIQRTCTVVASPGTPRGYASGSSNSARKQARSGDSWGGSESGSVSDAQLHPPLLVMTPPAAPPLFPHPGNRNDRTQSHDGNRIERVQSQSDQV